MARAIEADVAVVGAGLAGLVAASELRAAGREVVVLEARERVGGRTLDVDIGDGEVVELGGQFIGPGQDRVEALARELGLEAFATFAEGENVIALDGRHRRYSGTVPRLGPHVLADVELLRRSLDRLARRVPPEAPWEAPGAAALDGRTFASWLRLRARTRTARRLVALAGRTVWGAEPEELSLLHVAFYVRSAGGLFRLLDTEGGAQERRIAGGAQQLSLRLAERLGPERTVLGAPVRRIERGREGVAVHAGEVLARARRAVVAVPPHLAGRIAHDPPLPEGRDQLLQRTGQGAIAKCLAVYDEPFWRADGLSGQAVRGAGPVTLTFDDSPRDGGTGALLGFVGGADARAFARLAPEERRAEAVRSLADVFGPRAASPERYLELCWSEEPWSGGGPVASMPPGAWTAFGRFVREPVGRVHWAGSETATRWCGYLDGAVRSGERAAREVIQAEAG